MAFLDVVGYLLRSVLLLALLGTLAWGQDSSPKMAILEPILTTSNVNQREGSINPLETASRVIPKLAGEASQKLKWPVTIVDYKVACDAHRSLVSSAADGSKKLRFKQYKTIAEQLNARYVVTYVVREHTGHRAGGGLLTGGRVTGRTDVEVTVYDRESDEFVWQESVIDTSTAPGKNGLGARIDQSLFNALRKALEPFLLNGQTKKVAKPTVSYIATVKQVVSEGKRVLLDLGTGSEIAVGDVLTDLDGKLSVKVTEVLQNGSIGEVIQGEATAGAILKSAG